MKRVIGWVLIFCLVFTLPCFAEGEQAFDFPLLTESGTVQGTGYEHSGVDIHCAMGTPIYACADGVITYSEKGHTVNNKPHETPYSVKIKLNTPITYGKYTYISAYYTHFSSLVYDVAEGSKKSNTVKVKKGDLLGYSGTANYAPHLHFSFETSYSTGSRMMKTSELLVVLGLTYGQKWSGYNPKNDSMDSYADLKDSAYPTPITAYSQNNESVQMYNRIYGNESGIYNAGEPLTIQTVYHNGWVEAVYTENGESKTGFCKLSSFITQKLSPYSMTTKAKTKVYGRQDMAKSIGTVFVSDIFTVVNRTETLLQILYPLDAGGFKLGWINVTDAAASAPEEKQTALVINETSGYTRTEDGYIKGVPNDSMVNAVLSNIQGTALKIEGAQENMVGTGCILSLYNNLGTIDSAEIVVTGDLTGDGHADALDLLTLERSFLGTHFLSGASYEAATLSGNDTLSASDLLLLKKKVMQIE